MNKSRSPMSERANALVVRHFCLLALIANSAHAAPVSFTRDIAPILNDKCLTCHEPKKAKGRYRVDTFEQLLKPGESKEKPVTAGKPDTSAVFTRLVTKDEDDRMPQKDDALPQAQIDLFKRWINEGAKFDGDDAKQPLVELLHKHDKPKAPEKYPKPLPVTALDLADDGRTLFSSGYHELLVWNATDGKLQRRIPDMPERVLAISLQDRGDLIAVAGGTPGRSGECIIVSNKSGKVVKKLAGAKDTFLTTRFSPDGSLLALGGTDNNVRVFRTSDWKQLWKAEAHADWIMALAFSPDGNELVSASRDRTARVYDAHKGTIEFTFVEHQSAVLSATFDSEGETVITGAADGEVRRWLWQEADPENKDKKDSKEKKKPKSVVLKSKRQEVTALAVSGDLLYSASSDGRLRMYDLKHTGDPVEIGALGARAMAMCVDDTGELLLCAGFSGEVRAFDLHEKNKLLVKFKASP